MMKFFPVTLPVCAFLFVSGVLPVSAQEQPEAGRPKPQRVVNRIAASVNGRPITTAEVRASLYPILRELQVLYPKQGPKFFSELANAKKMILNDLIERELVLGEFEEKGYMMRDDHIETAINYHILTRFNGNRDAFLKGLQAAGQNLTDFRESIRKQEIVNAMRSSRFDRNIPPTPDEINAEYQKIKSDFRDLTQDSIVYDKIFIPFIPYDPSKTPDDQFLLAEEVAKKLKNKEISFADAAKEYSSDSMAEKGGRWDRIKRGELAAEFASVVFSAPVGEIVGPLVDRPDPQTLQHGGFTIVRVVDRSLAPAPPLSKVKEEVDASVRRKRSEERYRQWVERLRNKAIIRTFV